MRRTILFLFIIYVGFVYSGGFALSGVGSNGLSMGGAFTAVANDWTALYWNPAGMSFVQSDILGFHNAIVIPSSYVKPMTGIIGYDGPYSPVTKVNTKSQTFTIPSGGFVKEFKYLKDTKIGLAVFPPFGLGTSWSLYHIPIGFYNPSDTSTFYPPEFPEHNWESEVKTATMLIGFSRKFKKFSLGIAIGPTFERFKIRKVTFFDPATIDTHALSLPIQYRLFPIDSKIEVKGWAFSGSAGVIYQPMQKLRIGLSGRFYTKATLEGDAFMYLYFPYNDAIASAADSGFSYMFLGTVAHGYGTAKTKITLPFNLNVGISYEVNPRFLISAEVDYIHWSSFDQIIANFTDLKIKLGDMTLAQINADTSNELWNNTVKLSIGGRYKINDDIILRSGFYYDETPIPDTTLNPLIPDANSKLGFNVGGEYKILDFINLKFNYEFIYSSSKTIERDTNYSYRSSYFAGEYGFHVNALGIGVEYKF